MKFATCILSLGYTRLAGITLYDNINKEFNETTPKVAKQLIVEGLVKGVKWSKGEFVVDKEFNQTNILVKTAVGKYRPLLGDLPGIPINSIYTLVRVIDTDYNGKLYEIVSNKCQRIKVTEEQLKELSLITVVAGCFVNENEIKVCDGISIVNKTVKDSNIEIADTIDFSEEKKEESEESKDESEEDSKPSLKEDSHTQHKDNHNPIGKITNKLTYKRNNSSTTK